MLTRAQFKTLFPNATITQWVRYAYTGFRNLPLAEVDMGSLYWYYDGSYLGTGKRFFAYLADIDAPGGSEMPTMYCEKYETITAYQFYEAAGKNGCIAVVSGDTSYIELRDDNYTDAASFKAAMNGVKLHYLKKVN